MLHTFVLFISKHFIFEYFFCFLLCFPIFKNPSSSFCREILLNAVFQPKTKLGGPGIEVQIDESKFGRRKYYRGHRVEGVWVFGG